MKINKESSRDSHVDMMFTLSKEISNIILNEMSWKLCVNETNEPFWTSDHPCAGYNELEPEPFIGNMGLKCKGFQLHFPISDKLLLILMNPDIKLSDLKRFRNIDEKMKKFIEKISNKINPNMADLFPELEFVNVDRVIFENNLQVVSSTQFIFSNNNNFKIADDFLAINPIYKNKDRSRSNAS